MISATFQNTKRLVLTMLTLSLLGVEARAIDCGPEFRYLAGILSGREAAREVRSRRHAEVKVEQEYQRLRKDPERAGRSESELRRQARLIVRATLHSDDAREAFDRAVSHVEGKNDFNRQVAIFNDPARYLAPGDRAKDPTPLEDQLISKAAYEFLTKKGVSTANASHIADHIATLQDPRVARALEAIGVKESVLVRNALLHDLGKEYDQLPPEFRTFLEGVFPKPKAGEKDKFFLQRVILSHEFGSMLMAEKLAREAGIPEDKIPRLTALFAHHNAGYDPDLPGFHFWVQPFAWKSFATAMRANGVNVPEVYGAVLGTQSGGRPETIVLTAIDRATSLTLASQEKFAPVLVAGGKWNNEGLAGQFNGNANNVMAEVRNVLGKLEGKSAAEKDRFKEVEAAVTGFYEGDAKKLSHLGTELPLMAKGEGKYADRPATTADELTGSVLYRTERDTTVGKKGTWFRVGSDGKVYQGKGGSWALRADLSTPSGQTVDVPGNLFRKILFVDQDYQPRSLSEPRALTGFNPLAGNP